MGGQSSLTQSSKKTFASKLSEATNEDKQVNPAYVQELEKQFKYLRDTEGNQLLSIDTQHTEYTNTDGIGNSKAYGSFYILINQFKAHFIHSKTYHKIF